MGAGHIVKVRDATKKRLDSLKKTEKGEVTYDSIINWLLDQVEKAAL